ncbi:NAD(P)-binding domain-containing protein [Microbacterium sp. CIAB417]|uniref:NAD(P)-dependent oxidoreductase n=1 Tax=Microbacterium sp. CIAB417 TaxID=2860287 RepID=UPI0027E2DF0F|nr:NAD(P)-binding domain-containing protein [Microbacterium sp. CIAB417]
MIITVIGLGVMGAPMAFNLLAAGNDVIGINRSRSAVDRFVAMGGRTAELTAAIAASDAVITILPDSPDVRDVYLGDAGIVAHARTGTILVDMSTIDPEVSREIDARAHERGLSVLDAPVSGGEQAAIDGTLSIMVGGSADDLQRARGLFEVLGRTIIHVGPTGAGQTVKAANQLLVAGSIQLVAEALVFLRAHGVDLEPAVRVLAGGLAGNRILDRKAAGMIAHEFAPGFRIALHHKDLGIFATAARQAGVVTPLGAIVGQLMASAVANGEGDLDHSALLLSAERASGVDTNL